MSADRTLTYTSTRKPNRYMCTTCGCELTSRDLIDHTLHHNNELNEALEKLAAQEIHWTFSS